MQHTQGSWAISDTSIKDGSGGFISDIHAPNQDNPSLENGTDPTVATTWYRAIEGEEEANARLIASAPDLLKALKDLLASLENIDWEHLDWIDRQDNEEPTSKQIPWELAKKAIAKATPEWIVKKELYLPLTNQGGNDG